MSTCSFIIICKIVTFKVDEKVFLLVPKGDSKVLEAKKSSFQSRYVFWDFKFLFLVELCICLQNLIATRGVISIIFHKRVYWNSHTNVVFWQQKRHIKNCCFKNLSGEYILWYLLYVQKFLFSNNITISIFGGVSNFLKLIVFEQILAKICQFWVNLGTDFAAYTMIDSMPNARLKS
jgi:hypothetical protein